jgi:cytochrome b
MHTPDSTPPATTIRVWDLPTRLFHWSLVVAVVGLVVTGNVGGNWMPWHFRLGYVVFTLVLFRVIWGVVGGHWSRFAVFVPSPTRLLGYLKGQVPSLAGHNPLGALSVLAMLTVLMVQVATGLVSDDEIAFSGPLSAMVQSSWVSLATGYHKGPGKLMLLALVALHVAAIVFYQRVKRKRLVQSMVHGQMTAELGQPTPVSSDDGWMNRLLALAALGISAGVVAWVVNLASATV